MAATDCALNLPGTRGRILAAALAMPGLLATPMVQAESAPEHGEVAVKMLRYQDEQPGLQRVRVKAPSVFVLAPMGSQWSLEGSAVHDDVSGASPRYYTDVSGASRMHDKRNAFDAKVTRYFERSSVGLGVASSHEHDYRSRAVSLDTRFASADHNTTWNLGVAHTSDRIDPVNGIVVGERKRSTDLLVGITQAWTRRDLVQANLSLGSGRGYYNDPYKLYDERPRQRRQQVALLRWNHRLADLPVSLRSSYRYYQDSFGVRAHTLETAWVQPLGQTVTWTPLVRYYTQRAAHFYADPATDPALYPGPVGTPAFFSSDQRLSAFGGFTLGMKLDWQIDEAWHGDLKLERYEQRSNWRLGGRGSPGLAPFSATWLQVGLASRF